jgi:Domain of unknown function (DUF4381)
MNPDSIIADSIALKRLHDIVQPAAISLLPQTVGWYILLFLIILLIVFIALKKYRRYVINLYRRQALGELAAVEQLASDPVQHLKALSLIPPLLKRTALSFAPREQVASLTGQRWLAFLNNNYHGNGFTQGPGKILPYLSYQLKDISPEELTSLIELTRVWIREHRGRD